MGLHFAKSNQKLPHHLRTCHLTCQLNRIGCLNKKTSKNNKQMRVDEKVLLHFCAWAYKNPKVWLTRPLEVLTFLYFFAGCSNNVDDDMMTPDVIVRSFLLPTNISQPTGSGCLSQPPKSPPKGGSFICRSGQDCQA